MAQIPSPTQSQPHYYVDTPSQLQAFAQENESITWLGFDTEFISEKRFYPMLCLVQVITEHGVYLIDPMVLDDLTPFLTMVENPAILKITHAGDNDWTDYRYGNRTSSNRCFCRRKRNVYFNRDCNLRKLKAII